VAGIAALMAASIFLSGSRGGMAAFVVQIVMLAVLWFANARATGNNPSYWARSWRW